MALDEYGVPERKSEPDLFLDKQAEQAKQPDKQNQIWVTEQLKSAAREFYNSWHQTHTEKLADLSIDSLRVKFKDAETKDQFARLLTFFAEHCKGQLSTGVPLPNSETSGLLVLMRLEFFRPDVFSELLSDLLNTEAATIPLPADKRELAEQYLEAFGIPFIRFDLCAAEGTDPDTVAQLERTLADSQKKLVVFLKRLMESLPSRNDHRVIIHGTNDFEVDGEQKQFKGAALRALLALALLREKGEFHVDDFAKLYNGKKPVEARHDFDNGFNALKKELPKIARKASENNRTISGIKFRLLINDAVITERLGKLHKKA